MDVIDYDYTDYTVDNDLIVMVTYAHEDGRTRSFILNYNIYDVEVRLEDGTVITVLMRDSDTWNRELYSESETGDMLTDEIYKRNLQMEEDLNFKFEFIFLLTFHLV